MIRVKIDICCKWCKRKHEIWVPMKLTYTTTPDLCIRMNDVKEYSPADWLVVSAENVFCPSCREHT